VMPDPPSHSPRAKSLLRNTSADLNLKKYLEEQIELIGVLDDFIWGVCQFILGVSHSWPGKPELPAAHRKANRKGSPRPSTAK
jgi:hypothetical protein